MSFSIIGTGSAVPKLRVSNNDLKKFVDTSDEWIKTRTGIESRNICTDESLSEIAIIAAKNALKDANIRAEDIDLIICTTVRGDYITPSLACVVQGGIGANCASFDLNGACTGFIFALDVAASYFESKRAKKILIVSAEAMSRLVDWNDRATCVLFGDGAGAVILSEGSDLLSIKLTSKSDTSLLSIPSTTGNCPFSTDEVKNSFLQMNGQDVYKFAISAIFDDIDDVMKKANIDSDEVDFVLTHQANIRIINVAQSKLNIRDEKYLINIDQNGNTSSASIPILLDEFNKKGTFKKGNLLVMSAFGGGLTTGACIIRWSK